MQMALSPADRDLLIKILRLLSSPFDGESSAAGRRAHELVKRLGLDWSDVIGGVIERVVEVEKEADWHDVRSDDEADLVRRARNSETQLNDWERNFLLSIGEALKRWGRLTMKQREKLDQIIVKLKARGVW
jgi:hypothetical protein